MDMKKSLLLIPLLVIACKKESKMPETPAQDSVATMEQMAKPNADSMASQKKDSMVNNSPVTKEVLSKGVMRSEKDGQITRTVDAAQLPFTFGEEFTKDNQGLVLKITNFNKPEVKAKISTNEKDFNIRFNQIKLANGDTDGPFGKDISYTIPQKGEISLIIGKSNMASGTTKGKFTVSVE
ncbi:hypothetical protein CHRY9293_01848 [Chryseobacterium potabilaquae]|uniref:Uncharacterized protein n=2 Tax=Chryseobacterium TaxID=59732 RepID=A0A6N4X873_9FLAO|nr:hypothetical protein CHRY9293_01848 [Chryseobacterium potabilaquae]